MQIEGRVIPHKSQRYPTTGDYWFKEDLPGDRRHLWLDVRVSAMPDERYEDAVFVHEILEALLCKHAGIPEPTIKRFDELYEERRDFVQGRTHLEQTGEGGCSYLYLEFHCNCKPTETSEPGDDIHAPYYKQHQIATGVERIFIAETGASWNDYEKANQDLYDTDSR